jgi:uncharacterized Zn finger protein
MKDSGNCFPYLYDIGVIMGRYDYYEDYFPRYVSVAEKKEKARKSLEKLKKKNPGLQPVLLEGRKIARSWWGIAWCKNLEAYADYSNRIARGRSYVRNGSVLDLKITEGEVRALVQGSESRPYDIIIKIKPLARTVWNKIKEKCMGKIENMKELLEGKFPKSLEEIFILKGNGLFPSPKEIKFDCSCPDIASMCKHIASVLYGIGARLDNDPKLFFTLRKIKIEELVSLVVKDSAKDIIKKSVKKTKRVMDEADLSGVFGIDINTEITGDSGTARSKGKSRKKRTAEKED